MLWLLDEIGYFGCVESSLVRLQMELNAQPLKELSAIDVLQQKVRVTTVSPRGVACNKTFVRAQFHCVTLPQQVAHLLFVNQRLNKPRAIESDLTVCVCLTFFCTAFNAYIRPVLLCFASATRP